MGIGAPRTPSDSRRVRPIERHDADPATPRKHGRVERRRGRSARVEGYLYARTEPL